jgi:hypothetical protein
VTDIEFFFDPSCPWTWVTSRWLMTVAPQRGLAVTWRTWSLPIKNEGHELPASVPAEWRVRILAGRDFSIHALRVLEAAGSKEGKGALGPLYTEIGRRYHGDGSGPGALSDDEVLRGALAAAHLPTDLADAARDESWDEPIRDNMDEVRRQVGDEVGVPIIVIVGDNRAAMAGPVMSEVPPLERALALWDATATLIGEPNVFELKRHRTAGPVVPALDAGGAVAYPTGRLNHAPR